MSACFWFLRDPRKGDASKGHIHEKNVQINNHLADLVSYNWLRLLRLLYVYEQKRLNSLSTPIPLTQVQSLMQNISYKGILISDKFIRNAKSGTCSLLLNLPKHQLYL